jgi:hypothetical protein
MQYLSALTPPLLMCAAVLFAVGAFLRHEMGRKRSAEEEEPEEIPPPAPILPAQAQGERSVTGSAAGDGDS